MTFGIYKQWVTSFWISNECINFHFDIKFELFLIFREIQFEIITTLYFNSELFICLMLKTNCWLPHVKNDWQSNLINRIYLLWLFLLGYFYPYSKYFCLSKQSGILFFIRFVVRVKSKQNNSGNKYTANINFE